MAFFNKKGSGDWKGSKGGGYKPGGARKFNDRDGERPEFHSATCNKCRKECEVPFKPNGKKPVYCKDCFSQQEDGGRFERKSFDGPRPYAKPAYRSTPRVAQNDDVAQQLKMLNAKMDAILKAIGDGGSDNMVFEDEQSV